jgi:hypothetical protein
LRQYRRIRADSATAPALASGGGDLLDLMVANYRVFSKASAQRTGPTKASFALPPT